MQHQATTEATFNEELYSIPSKTVVAIPMPWHTLTESEKVLIEKILGSIKLSLNHVDVIQTDKLDVLKWVNRPKLVLAFGLELSGFSSYEPFSVQGIHVILAPALSVLEPDKDGKQKLWGGLKKVLAVL